MGTTLREVVEEIGMNQTKNLKKNKQVVHPGRIPASLIDTGLTMIT